MLAYNIDRLLEEHFIEVERDQGVRDSFGAEAKREFKFYAVITGLFWWWPMHGAGRFTEEAVPARAVNITGGGVMVKKLTPINIITDRISKITKRNTGLEVPGPFRIVSLRETSTHMELSVERP